MGSQLSLHFRAASKRLAANHVCQADAMTAFCLRKAKQVERDSQSNVGATETSLTRGKAAYASAVC